MELYNAFYFFQLLSFLVKKVLKLLMTAFTEFFQIVKYFQLSLKI